MICTLCKCQLACCNSDMKMAGLFSSLCKSEAVVHSNQNNAWTLLVACRLKQIDIITGYVAWAYRYNLVPLLQNWLSFSGHYGLSG